MAVQSHPPHTSSGATSEGGKKKKSLSSTPLRYTAYTDRGKY